MSLFPERVSQPKWAPRRHVRTNKGLEPAAPVGIPDPPAAPASDEEKKTPVVAQPGIRQDIQALRGWAVALVLLYHAGVPPFVSGFLGVDVFFVISGFLITGLIAGRVTAGSFEPGDFFTRRFRRLLPAAYCTFLGVSVLSPLLLSPADLADLSKQLAGAMTFSGNVVLWRLTGYFAGEADLKPLLHVWSLSIEEQYYLILPFALLLTPRPFWAVGSMGILFSSFLLCLLLTPSHPSAGFYLLPTRLWELAMGSVGVLVLPWIRSDALPLRLALWPALAALVVVPALTIDGSHPGLYAMGVCVATLVVLLRAQQRIWDGAALRPLVWLGDRSYSLYLVHWPLLAFANHAYLGSTPLAACVLVMVGAVAVSALMFRLVEDPIRRSSIRATPRLVGGLVATSVVVAAIPALAARSSRGFDPQLRAPNYGFHPACEYFGQAFVPKPECRDSDAPRTLVWGDSFGMHLVPGLAATSEGGVVQATRSLCAPYLGYVPFEPKVGAPMSKGRATSCMSFNNEVLDYLRATPSIEVVVLSNSLGAYADKHTGWKALQRRAGGIRETTARVSDADAAARATIDALREMGIKVVVIAPLPTAEFDVALCRERRQTGRLLLGPHASCRIEVTEYRRVTSAQREFLSRLAAAAGVSVIGFDAFLCDASQCATELGGKPLYRDADHMTREGSELLGKMMGLGGLVEREAR